MFQFFLFVFWKKCFALILNIDTIKINIEPLIFEIWIRLELTNAQQHEFQPFNLYLLKWAGKVGGGPTLIEDFLSGGEENYSRSSEEQQNYM